MLVNQAGKSISEVVLETRQVSEIIDGVRDSSRQQRSSLGQVAEAVACLDRSTQQNVSLVTQSATSSAGLKDQAARLVDAVAAFRLVEGDAAADHVARVPDQAVAI
jgi:methyl-accepting chemotaxis protein